MTLERCLQAFLDSGVTWGLCACSGAPKAMPEEEIRIGRAVTKRQQEFRAGRKAARDALMKLGYKPVAIRVGSGREPIWPNGVVGSISHTAKLAVAVVAPADTQRGLGVDLEEDIDLDEDLWQTLFTTTEFEWLYGIPDRERQRVARILFSAKEAVFKDQFPRTREVPDFTDLNLRLDTNLCRFDGNFLVKRLNQIAGPIRGKWIRVAGQILTLAVDPIK